jgi:7-cyano-7-deazaguanine synthase
MNAKKAVVLLSGGIDSSTALAVAKSEAHELYALSFDYGQRHKRELDSARMVAAALGVQRHLVIRFDLREIGGSALTSDMEVPKHKTQNAVPTPPPLPSPSRGEGKGGGESLGFVVPVTYVPARNTIFLSFALAWAEVLEAENIFIGANAIDYSGYPDCRPEYLAAFETTANLATKVSVEGKIRFKIKAPLISMKKSEIIRKGIELGLDYSLTWSCYDPQKIQKIGPATPPSPSRGEGKGEGESLRKGIYVPCGRCDSCLFRAKGFQEAGIKDPFSTLW